MQDLRETQGPRAQSLAARGLGARSSETASPFPSVDGDTGKDRVKEDGAGQSLFERFYDVIINSILVKISISLNLSQLSSVMELAVSKVCGRGWFACAVLVSPS